MAQFFLWVILLVLCWPLALLVYPIAWLVLLPFRLFRLVGAAVGGVLELIWGLVVLSAAFLRKEIVTALNRSTSNPPLHFNLAVRYQSRYSDGHDNAACAMPPKSRQSRFTTALAEGTSGLLNDS